MRYMRHVVSLLAVLVLGLVVVNSASAVTDIPISVEVNGVYPSEGDTLTIAAFAGQTMPVRVQFTPVDNVTDVRVKVWVSGGSVNDFSSDRFDVIAGSSYSKAVLVKMPDHIDPDEIIQLEVSIESRSDGIIGSEDVNLRVQRESYVLDLLDVELTKQIKAGDTLALDVVLKNRGRHDATDAFVIARIPALGIEDRAYFGDLSSVDRNEPAQKEDAFERRLFLNIPRNTPAGVYPVEIEAYTEDTEVRTTEKVAIVSAGADSEVVSPSMTKSFKVGETVEYSITLVNSGNRVMVYEIVPESSDDLTTTVAEPLVALPAGSSKTVKVSAEARRAGQYTFDVNIYSGGALVDKQSFVANVTGGSAMGSTNLTVLLTVVLAIIFVVLLVVLIVLLTRRPQKTEEFGESYY